MQEEERQDRLEATVHKYLCSYIKKTTGIDTNLTLLRERSNRHCDELNSLERERKKQEAFNRCMEAVSAQFYGLFKNFYSSYSTLLMLNSLSYDFTKLQITRYKNSKTIASIANTNNKTGNCYVYTNPPPSYRSTKSPSTGEVSTTVSQTSRSSPTASGSLVRGSPSNSTKASTIASTSAS